MNWVFIHLLCRYHVGMDLHCFPVLDSLFLRSHNVFFLTTFTPFVSIYVVLTSEKECIKDDHFLNLVWQTLLTAWSNSHFQIPYSVYNTKAGKAKCLLSQTLLKPCFIVLVNEMSVGSFLGTFGSPSFFPIWEEGMMLEVCQSTCHHEVQFSSVAQSCLTLCDPMNRSTPGLPVHHQLPEFTQTHVHWVGDAIQPSHPLSSLSPPAPNPSHHQSLFQWVSSSHEVAEVLEFQL